MLEHRLLTTEDYPELVKFWKDNRFSPIPQSALPNNGTGGLMVYQGDINICAGFIYNTNSSLCWLEFITSNFEVKDKKLRREALNYLILQLCESAKMMGKTAIFTSVKNHGLIQRFNDCGFEIGSNNTMEMIKSL